MRKRSPAHHPHALGALPTGDGFSEVYINGDWPRNTDGFAPTGSVLARLRQRNASHPDDIDAAVLKALEESARR